MAWLYSDSYEHRDEAQVVLDRLKKARKGKQYRYVQIAPGTWIEKEIKQPLNSDLLWTQNK